MGTGDILGPSHKREETMWREGADNSCFVDERGILGRRAPGIGLCCRWTWEDLDGWRCSGSHS